MKTVSLAALSVLLASTSYRPAEAQDLRVQANPLQAVFSAQDGRITSLAHNIPLSTTDYHARQLLLSPGEVWLTVDDAPPLRFGPEFTGFSVTRQGCLVAMQGRHPHLPLDVSLQWIGGADLECRVRLAGQLRLARGDGLRIVSAVNRQAYTSCSWEFAEGRVFRLREPLAGIVVQIPKR